ncbi:hypothetical protein ABBQ38_011355 [Trebouxia sp. C0009 RCD-2024]
MHSQHDDHKTGTWGQQQTDMQLTGGGTRVVQYGSAGLSAHSSRKDPIKWRCHQFDTVLPITALINTDEKAQSAQRVQLVAVVSMKPHTIQAVIMCETSHVSVATDLMNKFGRPGVEYELFWKSSTIGRQAIAPTGCRLPL